MTGIPMSEDDRPLLSVVVPFHDVEDYLEQTLASVRDQLLTDIEVVMIDDGSTDASSAIAQRFVDTDPRFRLLRQDNLGIGLARTRGADEARGHYLAFVDGDDLVAPRAYTSMVGTAQRTGSDVVAGNAKRFSAERSSYQSWTHVEAFARDDLSTTLAERPDLIRDRMVWNKVYRMTFWRQGGFSFPDMRYEDYPVVLDVYLRAKTVDVLSEHVYFWRDRESGTSITQQRDDIGNAQDRYRSAVMIFELLSRRHAPAEVRRQLQSYLARVDIVSLAETMVRVPEVERGEAETMAQHLADLIDPDIVQGQTQVSALLHRSLRERRMALARAVARWRAGGSSTGLARDIIRTRDPRAVAAVSRAFVATKAPQHPFRPRRLRSSLHEVQTQGDRLRFIVDTTLKAAFAHRAHVTASMGTPPPGGGSSGLLEVVKVEKMPWGVRTHLDLALPEASARPNASDDGRRVLGPVTLRLALPAGALRWVGEVEVQPDTLPEPVRVRDGLGDAAEPLAQVIGEPTLAVELFDARTSPVVVVDPLDDTLALSVLSPIDDDTPVFVRRPAPSSPYVLVGEGAQRVIDPVAAVSGDVADDVVTGIYDREIVIGRDGDVTPMLLMGESCRRPLPQGGVLEVARNLNGRVVLRRIP